MNLDSFRVGTIDSGVQLENTNRGMGNRNGKIKWHAEGGTWTKFSADGNPEYEKVVLKVQPSQVKQNSMYIPLDENEKWCCSC